MAQRAHIALIDVTGGIRFPRLQKVADAIERQVRKHVRPFWDVDADIVAMRHGEDLPEGLWPVRIVPEVRSGGGFHFDEHGAPYAEVGIGPHWTMSASHEIIEMVFDPTGSRFHAAPGIHLVGEETKNAAGKFEYLMEICDPCESADFAYPIDGVIVSDFYTPHYFDRSTTPRKRYSFNRGITGPRQVPKGGYLSWYNPALDKMQVLRNLARDPAPRIHTFDEGRPRRRSVREYIDGKFRSMQHLAIASWDHPVFRSGR